VWSIVHVLSSFGVGGQERVALDLSVGQRARGHEVSVLSLALPPGLNPGGSGVRLLRRGAAQLVHAFVAVSDTTAAQARVQHDAPPGKLHTIPNGIRLDRYAPDPEARAAARVELGLGDAWVVGTVGRLDPYKNQALLVRAMAPLLSSRVRLVIVGDGPIRPEVEAAVAALPEPRWVALAGRRMDVPRLVHAFDVFALSSTSEGLPLVVPEAMAAGLPIVTTSVGGLPGVVDQDETGLLVPVDEQALGAALARLERDRDLARAMGAKARQAALARFGHDRMVEAYLALYGQARR
jgi:glycosyltransferase involved in cell wall biosynthesis